MVYYYLHLHYLDRDWFHFKLARLLVIFPGIPSRGVPIYIVRFTPTCIVHLLLREASSHLTHPPSAVIGSRLFPKSAMLMIVFVICLGAVVEWD